MNKSLFIFTHVYKLSSQCFYVKWKTSPLSSFLHVSSIALVSKMAVRGVFDLALRKEGVPERGISIWKTREV